MAYGMRPHKVAGAGYFNGGFEEFPIDISAQTTNIWQGDVVALANTGEVVREGSTPSTPTRFLASSRAAVTPTPMARSSIPTSMLGIRVTLMRMQWLLLIRI